MTLDPQFRDLHRSTVTIASRTGQDGYGKPSYGAGTQYRAKVERHRKALRTAGGDEVWTSARVILMDAPGVTVNDRITLPDGTTPKILDVATLGDDTTEASYEVVYV